MKRFYLSFAIFFFLPLQSLGNVIGTELQHFNPTYSGLDYVTVQSSQTLEPGIFNLGLFTNAARNGLPEFDNDKNTYKGRTRLRNSLVASDLNFGLGLLPGWDVGMNVSATHHQDVSENVERIEFDQKGLNEVRISSKLRLWNQDHFGIATVFSTNINLIENNPYHGTDAAPSLNGEIVFDSRWQRINVALNLGYRFRNPGEPLDGIPIKPLENQYIASVASSLLLPGVDILLIGEIFASEPVNNHSPSAHLERSAESLVGAKYFINHNLAAHIGTSTFINDSTSSPDLRLFVGVNWTTGPLWQKPIKEVKPKKSKVKVVKRETFIFNNILFLFDSEKLVPNQPAAPITRMMNKVIKKGFKIIYVHGHTDSIGSEEYNLSLSQKRADVIRRFLIKAFKLNSDQVVAEGKGENFPIAANDNYQGRERNRRVEINVEY